MKSTKILDSVVFQLTPTRTRFDLVISAKGKTEKIGSGLLDPFLSHLKTAKDQIDKGGYSILLELGPDSDKTWFTKGTVERFVRFVSSPEIIERVYSLESEILQLEKAIAIQGTNDMGSATVEENQAKYVGNKEGIKHTSNANDEKAIVLYKEPEVHPPEAANGSTPEHGNSKVQLLKVLETRKTVLEKEQGMAFARAVAAGYDIDHMASLLSFAECFGASRLMDACLRFLDLWKQKHETGKWVEAAEAMSIPPDFSAMNASGIMLSSKANQQTEPLGDLASETNGKPVHNSDIDERHPPQAPVGQQGYYQGQFPYPMFPTWPAHSLPGALPVYQPYPVQGVPYYQPYPGSGPFYPSPHPPMEDSERSNRHSGRRRSHSADSRDSNSESEEVVSESGDSQAKVSRKKVGKSAKKKPGLVVIRNINYVASKGRNNSDSESDATSNSDTDGETVEEKSSSLKRKGSNTKSEEPMFEKESGGHWDAFQSFLLRDSDEKSHGEDQSIFGLEKKSQPKRRPHAGHDDPLDLVERESIEAQDGRISDLDKISGNITRMLRPSNDERIMSRREGYQMDNQMDVQFTEMNGRKLAYRNNTNDDLMVVGREGQSYASHSADPLSIIVSHSGKHDNGNSQMTDDSFLVPYRSMSIDQVTSSERIVIDMDSELPSANGKSKDSSNKTGQANYEPDYLSLTPERVTEKVLMRFDPSLEYEMQAHVGDSSLENKNKEVVADAKQKKSKVIPDSSDKKKTVGPMRRGKPSKSSPLDDARARAEKLRSYKADLQKLKKEKEEEQQKRLDALKKERQNRIAARGGSTAAPSLSLQQPKKQLPTRTSLTSHRGSKFSDIEPGSFSPLQRSKLRTVSLGTPESQKASKTTKSTNDIQLPTIRATKSISSLAELRKEKTEVTPDPKASMARIRRLSEPKASSSSSVASIKTRTPPLVSRPKVSAEPESKKIAAIINLDKSKAATLPELKIKTSKGPLGTGHNKSTSEETSQKVNKPPNDEDDDRIVDKTVLIFEPEKPSSVMGVQNEQHRNHEKVETAEVTTRHAVVRAPASSPPDGIEIEPMHSQLLEKPRSYEVNGAYTDKELPRTSSAQTSEIPYQPPFARLSSIEGPSSQNTEYGETLPTKSKTSGTESQNDNALRSGFANSKIEKIPEAQDKTPVKDSPKGFKRLLKFGKKSHSSAAGDQRVESDKATANGSELNDKASNAESSTEVHSLKNLISHDLSPAGGTTTQKSSRHFSLLSPFRSKTSEKKSTA